MPRAVPRCRRDIAQLGLVHIGNQAGEILGVVITVNGRSKQWVVHRKATVVAAVRFGWITMQEALLRYQLTEEEFLSWQHAFEAHGLPGLRATRVQQYREPRRLRGPRLRR